MPETTAVDDREPGHLDRSMRLGENTVYTLVAVLLLVCALLTVGSIAYHVLVDLDDGVVTAVTAALDGLLLVFILVELFGAVRATVAERTLVAEPFLVVGIIAAIKEIVVSSLEVSEAHGEEFDERITELGVLAGVVLLLAVSSFLVRRKEREPTEG